MTNLCIRCGQSPAVRAWMYCETCWRIIIGLPEPSPAEPKAAIPSPAPCPAQDTRLRPTGARAQPAGTPCNPLSERLPALVAAPAPPPA